MGGRQGVKRGSEYTGGTGHHSQRQDLERGISRTNARPEEDSLYADRGGGGVEWGEWYLLTPRRGSQRSVPPRLIRLALERWEGTSICLLTIIWQMYVRHIQHGSRKCTARAFYPSHEAVDLSLQRSRG